MTESLFEGNINHPCKQVDVSGSAGHRGSSPVSSHAREVWNAWAIGKRSGVGVEYASATLLLDDLKVWLDGEQRMKKVFAIETSSTE